MQMGKQQNDSWCCTGFILSSYVKNEKELEREDGTTPTLTRLYTVRAQSLLKVGVIDGVPVSENCQMWLFSFNVVKVFSTLFEEY